MESIFEQQRRSLETLDIVEFLISESYISYPRKTRERLLAQNQIKILLEESAKHIEFLSDSFNISPEFLFSPNSSSVPISPEASALIERRAAEMSLLESNIEMKEFYNRLRSIKEFHRPHPDDIAGSLLTELSAMQNQLTEKGNFPPNCFVDLETKFSGEEGFGRFLDLNPHYESYINLNQIKKIDYFSYLDTLSRFDEVVPKDTRKSPSYKRYLEGLYEYLKQFVTKSKPLINISYVESEYLKDFDSEFQEPEEKGLYCDACDKFFAKDTVFNAHLQGTKHRKALETPRSDSLSTQKYGDKQRRTAQLEYLIKKIVSRILSDELSATKSNLERKQSRTAEELMEDIEEEEEEVEEKTMDLENHLTKAQEEKLYNPLKIPLGWDGKPIPYWLYKLHGLGVSYSCEICGNYVYMGRKAFDKHFQEWRHSYGMRCLGIPNTRHFQDITLIKDVLSLWEKVKRDTKVEVFKPETMEEFEDLEGNVYSRKLFEDLHRQGLL